MKPVIANSIGNFYKSGNLEFRAEKSRELGFDTIEMTMFDVQREGLEKCVEVVKNFGFKVADMHASFTDPVDTKPNIFKSNLLKAIECAKAFGTNVVTFHPGFYENDISIAQKKLVQVLKEVIEIAKQEGVALVMENLVRWRGQLKYIIVSEREVEWILSELPIGLLYDINHGHQEKHNIYEMVKNNKSRLFGFHVGDARFGKIGTENEHLPFGKGDIDFQRLCNLVKDTNIVLIIELINHGTFEDLKIFKEKLEELLSG